MKQGRIVRFRADPSKVRTALRPSLGFWFATVETLNGDLRFTQIRTTPKAAMDAALELASNAGMIGVDLGMGWAYDHPWGILT